MKKVQEATRCTVVVLLTIALLSLTGCAQKPELNPANLPVQGMESDDLIVGTPGNGAKATSICNRTGQAIVSLSLKLSTEEAFGEPYISQVWNNEQNVKFFFSTSPTSPTEGSLLFDARLTLDNGSVFTISGIDLLAYKQANLRLDEESGLLYLEGVNALSQPISTLKQSIETKAAEEEAARLAEEQALAEAQAAAEAEAAAAAAAAANQGSYSYNYSGGGSSGSGNVSQSSDVCVDDLLFR